MCAYKQLLVLSRTKRSKRKDIKEISISDFNKVSLISEKTKNKKKTGLYYQQCMGLFCQELF